MKCCVFTLILRHVEYFLIFCLSFWFLPLLCIMVPGGDEMLIHPLGPDWLSIPFELWVTLLEMMSFCLNVFRVYLMLQSWRRSYTEISFLRARILHLCVSRTASRFWKSCGPCCLFIPSHLTVSYWVIFTVSIHDHLPVHICTFAVHDQILLFFSQESLVFLLQADRT